MRIGKFTSIIILLVSALVTMAAMSSTTAVFFDARFEPPSGRVLSGWGQFSSAWDLGQPAGKGDADDLEAYRKAVAPHAPAMISFDVAPDSTIVSGFLKHYREFAATHGFFVAQIGYLFSRQWSRRRDRNARSAICMVLADGLREVGRPVLLRIGYEFNNLARCIEPSAYIGAFRHVTEVMRKDHVNFAAVWDATAREFCPIRNT